MLKQQDGPDLQVHGSGNLIQTLLAHDLVDELWLKIFPVTLGQGKRLFDQGTLPASYTLVKSQSSPSGVIIATFKRAGSKNRIVCLIVHDLKQTDPFGKGQRKPYSNGSEGGGPSFEVKEKKRMNKITPHLWFDKEAKEAAQFYTSVFPNSKVTTITTLHDTPSGDCDLVSFELSGQPFMAISAGPPFKFNPSVSFIVNFDPKRSKDARENR